jgi:hypothetical protein
VLSSPSVVRHIFATTWEDSRVSLPWRWRQYVPPKHWFQSEPRGTKSQKSFKLNKRPRRRQATRRTRRLSCSWMQDALSQKRGHFTTSATLVTDEDCLCLSADIAVPSLLYPNYCVLPDVTVLLLCPIPPMHFLSFPLYLSFLQVPFLVC